MLCSLLYAAVVAICRDAHSDCLDHSETGIQAHINTWLTDDEGRAELAGLQSSASYAIPAVRPSTLLHRGQDLCVSERGDIPHSSFHTPVLSGRSNCGFHPLTAHCSKESA